MSFQLDLCYLCLKHLTNEFKWLCKTNDNENITYIVKIYKVFIFSQSLPFEDFTNNKLCLQCSNIIDMMYKYAKHCLRNAKIFNHYKKKLCASKKGQHSDLNICLSTTEIDDYRIKQKKKRKYNEKYKKSKSAIENNTPIEFDVKIEPTDDNLDQYICPSPNEVKEEIDITENYHFMNEQILREEIKNPEEFINKIKYEVSRDFIVFHGETSDNNCETDTIEIIEKDTVQNFEPRKKYTNKNIKLINQSQIKENRIKLQEENTGKFSGAQKIPNIYKNKPKHIQQNLIETRPAKNSNNIKETESRILEKITDNSSEQQESSIKENTQQDNTDNFIEFLRKKNAQIHTINRPKDKQESVIKLQRNTNTNTVKENGTKILEIKVEIICDEKETPNIEKIPKNKEIFNKDNILKTQKEQKVEIQEERKENISEEGIIQITGNTPLNTHIVEDISTHIPQSSKIENSIPNTTKDNCEKTQPQNIDIEISIPDKLSFEDQSSMSNISFVTKEKSENSQPQPSNLEHVELSNIDEDNKYICNAEFNMKSNFEIYQLVHDIKMINEEHESSYKENHFLLDIYETSSEKEEDTQSKKGIVSDEREKEDDFFETQRKRRKYNISEEEGKPTTENDPKDNQQNPLRTQMENNCYIVDENETTALDRRKNGCSEETIENNGKTSNEDFLVFQEDSTLNRVKEVELKENIEKEAQNIENSQKGATRNFATQKDQKGGTENGEQLVVSKPIQGTETHNKQTPEVESKYVCHICNIIFNTKSKLEAHKQLHDSKMIDEVHDSSDNEQLNEDQDFLDTNETSFEEDISQSFSEEEEDNTDYDYQPKKRKLPNKKNNKGNLFLTQRKNNISEEQARINTEDSSRDNQVNPLETQTEMNSINIMQDKETEIVEKRIDNSSEKQENQSTNNKGKGNNNDIAIEGDATANQVKETEIEESTKLQNRSSKENSKEQETQNPENNHKGATLVFVTQKDKDGSAENGEQLKYIVVFKPTSNSSSITEDKPYKIQTHPANQESVELRNIDESNKYICNICDAKFTRKSKLDSHNRQIHNLKKIDKNQEPSDNEISDDYEDFLNQIDTSSEEDEYNEHVFQSKRRSISVKTKYGNETGNQDLIDNTNKIDAIASVRQQEPVKFDLGPDYAPKKDKISIQSNKDQSNITKNQQEEKVTNTNGDSEISSTEKEQSINYNIYKRNNNAKFPNATLPGKEILFSELPELFACGECKKQFKSQAGLDTHNRYMHGPKKEQPECDICHSKFSNEVILQNHKSVVHSSLRPYRCKYCEKCFKTNFSRKLHENVHTGKRSYTCEFCGKSFTYRGVLRSHKLSVHGNGEKPYACTKCDARFLFKVHLSNHQSVHSEERNFKCDECDKAFKRKYNLTIHKLNHSNIRKFECHICKRKFNLNPSLQRHLLTHTGERNFECADCGKTFPSKANLKLHLLSHSKKLTHECDICQKKFTAKFYMDRHRAFHFKKPYSCNICKMEFTAKHNLTNHKKKHEMGILNEKGENIKMKEKKKNTKTKNKKGKTYSDSENDELSEIESDSESEDEEEMKRKRIPLPKRNHKI